MADWKPIETAPMDGTWVLIRGGKPDHHYDWDAKPPPCVVAQWQEDEHQKATDKQGLWRFCSFDGGYYGEWEEPAEWMPLPTPQEPTT